VKQPSEIRPAEGKLGVLLPGFGAVATTFVAGVEAARQGLAAPIGSLTQMNTIRLGKRTENRTPLIKDFVPLSGLEDIVFGAWDPIADDGYESAVNAGVLDRHKHIEPIKDFLSSIEPMPAAFDPRYVKKLTGPNVKKGANKRELAEQIREDIRRSRRRTTAPPRDGVVRIDRGLRAAGRGARDHRVVREGDGREPRRHRAEPALRVCRDHGGRALRQRRAEPVRGLQGARGPREEERRADLREGLQDGPDPHEDHPRPGFKTRMLGVSGWFSTNILGNRDGEVLDDPESFKTKEVSKLGVLESILQPDKYPELYGNMYHKVRINYYPPRGDNKEGWDNIDIFGWMGYEMQIKVDFLCRDSILAAPIVLDLALFLDLASRAGMGGIQEWLSFYFKSPQTAPGLYPEHDIFIQHWKLKNTLRWMMGEETLTHLGVEYYD
jgi:myo-inositol-1-phosphate synthase